MEDIDKSSILVSALHLKEAALLLAEDEADISLTLLKLAKYLMEQNGLLSSDIDDAELLIKKITKKDDLEEIYIHRADNK